MADRDDAILEKLADVGLIERRGSGLLGQFVRTYVDGRKDVKPATKEIWGQGSKGMLGFFGEERPIREITPADADAYKLHLIEKKLAPMTVRKRLQFAKMITRAAIRSRLIGFDPFVEVNVKPAMPVRARFITPEETVSLLKASPHQAWRTIIALARWGGLRCPSEVLSVRFGDVDWDGNKLLVTSPKTAHHPGKGSRVIPLFPELRVELQAAYDIAPEGTVYVVPERYRVSSTGPHGWRNCNLRTTFEKIIRTGRSGSLATAIPQPALQPTDRTGGEFPLARSLRLARQQRGHRPPALLSSDR